MYDFVNKHKRWLQIALLVLIVPPFALFGIDFYFRNTDTAGSLAKVGDARISEVEFSQALRQAQEKMREMMKSNPDPSLLNSPQLKESVLNELIERKVTLSQAAKEGMTISDSELQKMIAGVEAFHDQSGKFSRERYRQLLQGHHAGAGTQRLFRFGLHIRIRGGPVAEDPRAGKGSQPGAFQSGRLSQAGEYFRCRRAEVLHGAQGRVCGARARQGRIRGAVTGGL
jgi:hypothetical protein